jgi:hypothetical protein
MSQRLRKEAKKVDTERRGHRITFYATLSRLENILGGAPRLADCSGRMAWPGKGVYFVREAGETRTDTGTGPRIVRVGTQALKAGSGTRLWTRLSQHKGQTGTGGGNHRGSIRRHKAGLVMNRIESVSETPVCGIRTTLTNRMSPLSSTNSKGWLFQHGARHDRNHSVRLSKAVRCRAPGYP